MTSGAAGQAIGTIAVKKMALSRVFLLDALRGVAVLAMIAYHLSWDLHHFQLAEISLFSAPWRWFSYFIAGTFLLAVGISLVLAQGRGFRAATYFRRLGIIALCAGIISAVTWVAFDEAFIFFGILNCIVVSSVLGLVFLRVPVAVVAGVGLAVLLAPLYLKSPAFDASWLWWLGLNITTPQAYDYVPLFPWFAWPLFGIVLGRMAITGRIPASLLAWSPNGAPAAGLRWLGRHSLLVYMLHQPVLFGLAWGLASLLL